MPVVDVSTEPEQLTATFVCELPATPETIWRIWAEPRLLERWWGPPGYPVTVAAHDFTVGGIVEYAMTGPDGERFPGGMQFVSITPGGALSFRDYFLGEDGQPSQDLGTTTEVAIEPLDAGRARMTMVSRFPSREAMAELEAMGAVEGMTGALGQLDDVLASLD